MKKIFIIIIISLCLFSCDNISVLERDLGINFPNNYKIIKDTIEGEIDFVVKIQLEFNKKDLNKVLDDIKHSKKNFNLKQNFRGYEFDFLIKPSYANARVEIDTIKNMFYYNETHF